MGKSDCLSRRSFLKALGVGAVSLAGARVLAGRSNVVRRPNVLFILVDDMGWPDVACYGNKFHDTPHIDKLAGEGMRFTDAYAACPVCSPTRASIMAGQYPARVGITDFIPGHWRPWERQVVPENRLALPLETVTVGEAMKGAGYKAGYIGKWHLGNGREFAPDKQGFEVLANGQNVADKWVTSFTEKTLGFLEANKDGPFFMFLSHHTVHIKLEAPKELVEKYENKAKPATGVNHPVYAAMVEHLDNSVGRLMAKLDELGLRENTVVIFFSDNGGLRQRYDGAGDVVSSNAPLRDEKGTLYEGGVRVPLIVRWPGKVEAASVCDAAVTSVDFYPTLVEIGGGKAPVGQVLDGESIVGLLTGSGSLKRDSIYWHYPHYHHSRPAGSIRRGPWKLVEFFEDGRCELYNLKDDIGEKRDLASEMPDRTRRLQKKLAAWRESVGAKMPTTNADYDADKADQWRPRR